MSKARWNGLLLSLFLVSLAYLAAPPAMRLVNDKIRSYIDEVVQEHIAGITLNAPASATEQTGPMQLDGYDLNRQPEP